MVLKKGRTKDLKDFRPISLIGSIYKLIAKVLANKLKRAGWSTKPTMLLLRGGKFYATLKAIDGYWEVGCKKRERGSLCKLDVERAYDHKLGFPHQSSSKDGVRDKMVRLD